jgi:hypothetical protein
VAKPEAQQGIAFNAERRRDRRRDRRRENQGQGSREGAGAKRWRGARAEGAERAEEKSRQFRQDFNSVGTHGRGSLLVLEDISLLVVHAEIQAVAFLLLGDAQAECGIDDFKNGERAHDGQAPRDSGAPELVEDLAAVAVH